MKKQVNKYIFSRNELCDKYEVDQKSCFQFTHVLKKHKAKIIGVLLFPWTLFVGGILVAIEAIAHLFGCHLGIGGF